MHKCTIATVIVHIYTITVALLYIILIISNFAPFFLSLHLQNQCRAWFPISNFDIFMSGLSVSRHAWIRVSDGNRESLVSGEREFEIKY